LFDRPKPTTSCSAKKKKKKKNWGVVAFYSVIIKAVNEKVTSIWMESFIISVNVS